MKYPDFTPKNTLWAMVFLFSLISFVTILSITPYIVYTNETELNLKPLARHISLVVIGFVAMWIASRIKSSIYANKAFSIVAMIACSALLAFSSFKGTKIEGVDADRWIFFLGIRFQPSILVIMASANYVASHLKYENYKNKFSPTISFICLSLPLAACFAVIARNNLSMAIIYLAVVGTQIILSQFPIKYALKHLCIVIPLVCAAFLVNEHYSSSSRLTTWISRLKDYSDNREENLQVKTAKMAVASGGFLGQGAGKGTIKNILKNGESDFMFASIVEEYGAIVGGLLIVLYLIFFINIISISLRVVNNFDYLQIIGQGMFIFVQALVNIGVSISAIPVTGQSLPFFSSSGTSILITSVGMGLIISSSKEVKERKKADK